MSRYSHNDAHTILSAMSFDATLGVETRARKRKRELRDASAANAGEAIPGLLNDIVITHVLRSENFDDPADLARLPAVSRAMRDAVAATGLTFEELDELDAVELGCLSALRRQKRGGRLQNPEYLCVAAALSGQLEELKLLRENDAPWDAGVCWAAAYGGHFEILKWARANGAPWGMAGAGAAGGGHLELLQWLHANGCPWEERTCEYAAIYGQLEILKWLSAERCPWDAMTCSGAAEGGQLEVLQWARANGCPWDENTCAAAAEYGHLGVLRWAIENGCPWDWQQCMDRASENDQKEVLVWLDDNEAPNRRWAGNSMYEQ